MGRRLSRGHFRLLKNGISSVADISHGWKMVFPQLRAFLTAEKWYFLGRRHFSRLKSALDSVAEHQMSNVGTFSTQAKKRKLWKIWNSNLSRPHASMRRSIQTSFVVLNAHTIMAFGSRESVVRVAVSRFQMLLSSELWVLSNEWWVKASERKMLKERCL